MEIKQLIYTKLKIRQKLSYRNRVEDNFFWVRRDVSILRL